MFFKDFQSGVGAYSQAFKLLTQLKLWRYCLVPALIGLFIGVCIIAGAYTLSDTIGDYLSAWYPFEFGKSVVDWIADFLSGAILIIFGFLIYKNLVIAFSAPFMGPVSEKIERHLLQNKDTARPSSNFWALLIRGIRISLRNIILEILMTIPLLLFSFVPLLNIVSTFFLFYLQSYYVGFGNMDYTLERHKKYNETPAFVRKNKGLAVGNGFVFMFMLFIPFLGIMLTLPVSAAAATIVTVKRLKLLKP